MMAERHPLFPQADPRAHEQHIELRLHQAVGQLDATKRSAQAVRVRLEADLQAARARIQQLQETLGASHATTEELRVTNAELSTALDATQWRLGELEAGTTAHQETLRRVQQERDTDRQHLEALERTTAATAAEHAQLSATLAALQARSAALDETVTRLQAEGTQRAAALDAARAQQAEERHARDELQQRLRERDAERQTADAREVALRHDLHALRDEYERLRATTTEELNTWQETAAQREAELVGAREHLARWLEDEQGQARSARAEAAALGARVHSLEDERDALRGRIQSMQDDVREREAQIQQVQARLAQLSEQHTQTAQAATDAARQREEEWHATQRRLERDLDTIRAALAEADASTTAARERNRTLEDQLQQRPTGLEAAAASAHQHAAALAAAEQRATDQQCRREALEQQLDEVQKQTAATLQRRDATAAQLLELQNDRSALTMRIDELTALNGQLERECERLRRDRVSGEETRRLKSEYARLEAKIVELDRQRSEAVQRHSAAVAGYMVELNQRSEALRAREVELQKLTEELTIVKQSCEDAMSELAAQRQTQAALERQLAEVRASAAGAAPGAEPARATPASAPRPSAAPQAPAQLSVAKPAKRSTQGDAMNDPMTVIHLEENEAFRAAAREVVSRVPESRYVNTLDPAVPNAAGSRLLVVNLLSRTHDPLQAITSFIAADTYHQNVFAYCAEGANGFSFRMADFFAPPLDPDTCVARLMESRGAIQRLLVVTENFTVVGALRDVLSRMKSSVSAALDLRQVMDLLPMVGPDIVLIDLALPRGDGLRLVSRLRSDPKTHKLPLGILLAAPANAAELRQHALRAARDLPMSAAELTAALTQRLAAPHPAAAPTRLRASLG